MGFNNINGPTGGQPIIKGAQNLGKDGGGGGNTGYMNMRGKKKKKDEEEGENSVFFEEGTDAFVSSKKKKEENSEGRKRFFTSLANFMKKQKETKGKEDGSDTFIKSDEEDKFQTFIEIEKENAKLEREIIKHPPVEDEYEIIDTNGDTLDI